METYPLTGEIVKLIVSPTVCLQLSNKVLVVLRSSNPIMLVVEDLAVTEISKRNSPKLFDAVLDGFESRNAHVINEQQVKSILLKQVST